MTIVTSKHVKFDETTFSLSTEQPRTVTIDEENDMDDKDTSKSSSVEEENYSMMKQDLPRIIMNYAYVMNDGVECSEWHEEMAEEPTSANTGLDLQSMEATDQSNNRTEAITVNHRYPGR